jgi:hypothetical protein
MIALHANTEMQKSFWQIHDAIDYRFLIWRKEIFNTWEWWLELALTIIPWIIWVYLHKKNKTYPLLSAGILASLLSLTLDNFGMQLSAWDYLKPVTPFIPSIFPFDFTLLPVIVMFLIQHFYNKNAFIVGLLFGIFTAYIGEPLFTWLKIYEPVYWKHIYSVPFYMGIYFVCTKLFLRLEET